MRTETSWLEKPAELNSVTAVSADAREGNIANAAVFLPAILKTPMSFWLVVRKDSWIAGLFIASRSAGC
jgi:hypothetical protein